jgi:putative ABC transport system substrate-binding protein
MRRREFITLVGGGAATWPLVAHAQQPAMPVIGFLSDYVSPESAPPVVNAFRQGLSETGFIEDHTVRIEYRWARGQYEQLPILAAELVRNGVAVIVTSGSPRSALAAKSASSTIPIVFVSGADPIQFGVVANLNRPEGNATGVTLLTTTLITKRFELLHELTPHVNTVAFLVNPNNPNVDPQTGEVQEAARSLGLELIVVKAGADDDFETAFTAIVQQKAGALIVSADSFLTGSRARIVALTARYAVPTMYQWRDFVEIGGLMSYGANLTDAYRQVGVYTGRILKGAKPTDLPVLQPTKFELVINLKTAKALGLTIPSGVLAIADEVIE